jgi:N-acetylglucosaminyl-diphospho-decaprenol L-rhamnosyltransferase
VQPTVHKRPGGEGKPELQTVEVRVTIAIVTYRSLAELPSCLESILASDVPVRVVIIDNDSSDGTFELARTYSRKHRNILAISSPKNIGLAAGNNLVIPHIYGDYLLILNPDTIIKPTTISSLIGILDADRSIGVVGPMNLYADGKRHTSYHRGWNLMHLFLWRVLPYALIRRMYDEFALYRRRNVYFVSGACLFVRASLFRELGGYDEQYFLTVEDACDLCRRARQRGYKTLFEPSISINHLCGRSGSQVPFLATLEGYRGSIYYFGKHSGWIGSSMAFGIILLGCISKIAASTIKVILLGRVVDIDNLRVYARILPILLGLEGSMSSAREP